MGIQVEFNPYLALRATGTKGRLESECIPQNLQAGQDYPFLKKGQRNYWLQGELPLLTTDGNGNISRPLASIKITSVTHFLECNEVWTSGRYHVTEVYDPKDQEIHFEGINNRR